MADMLAYRGTKSGGSMNEFEQPPVMRQTGQRKVGILLFLGILLFPVIFAWFLLRSGHSSLSRILGFGWMLVVLLPVIL